MLTSSDSCSMIFVISSVTRNTRVEAELTSTLGPSPFAIATVFAGTKTVSVVVIAKDCSKLQTHLGLSGTPSASQKLGSSGNWFSERKYFLEGHGFRRAAQNRKGRGLQPPRKWPSPNQQLTNVEDHRALAATADLAPPRQPSASTCDRHWPPPLSRKGPSRPPAPAWRKTTAEIPSATPTGEPSMPQLRSPVHPRLATSLLRQTWKKWQSAAHPKRSPESSPPETAAPPKS